MKRVLLSLFALLLPLSFLPAQTIYNKNPFQFHTHWYWIWAGQYPNFRTTGGNLKGDCAWRVYPPEAVRNGNNRMSIIEWGGAHWIFDDVSKATYQGNTLPDVEYRAVTTNKVGFHVPDFSSSGLFGRFSPGKFKFSGKGPGAYWTRTTLTSVSAAIKVTTRKGYAYVRYAVPGEKYTGTGRPTSGVGYVLSALEVVQYGLPERFSGNYVPSTKTWYYHDDMISGTGNGVLYQWNSILEPSGLNWHQYSIQGKPSSYDEGLGAYWTGIHFYGGDLRWHFHSSGKPLSNYMVVMFANMREPKVEFPIAPGQKIFLLPLDPIFTLFASAGFMNTLARGSNGYARWDTPVLKVPRSAALRGRALWTAAVFFDYPSLRVSGVSQTVVTRFY